MRHTNTRSLISKHSHFNKWQNTLQKTIFGYKTVSVVHSNIQEFHINTNPYLFHNCIDNEAILNTNEGMTRDDLSENCYSKDNHNRLTLYCVKYNNITECGAHDYHPHANGAIEDDNFFGMKVTSNWCHSTFYD